MYVKEPLVLRLQRRLHVTSSGCREWMGATNPKGYGNIRVEGKTLLTHRVAWTLKHGPIPPGIKVLHHCDNPPCGQTEPTEGYPDGHLLLGTYEENMADMVSKGRASNGRALKPQCFREHDYTPENTHIRSNGTRQCKTCGRENTAAYTARNRQDLILCT